MASPSQDTIATYMSLTGASHSFALQKLEEHGGNLNEAVNAHFGGGDRDSLSTSPGYDASPEYSFTHTDGQSQVAPYPIPQYSSPHNMSDQHQVAPQGLASILSAARSFRPSLLLDPNYSRDLFNRIGSEFTGRTSPNLHPGAVSGVPMELNGGNNNPHLSGQRPIGPDTAGNSYGNDVEEEMLRAAIEASKQEADAAYLKNMLSRALNVYPVSGVPESQLHLDNDDFDRALSLSLKTAEEEKAKRKEQGKDKNQKPGIFSAWKRGRSLHQDGAGVVEQKQGSQELKLNVHNDLQHDNPTIHSEEFGSISAKEFDEAILLETALFGEASRTPNSPSGPSRNLGPNMQPVDGPSLFSLTRQLLREQQDDEYLASILVDKEKEIAGAGTCHSKELESDKNKINQLDEHHTSILADKEKEIIAAGTCHSKELESDKKKINPLELERKKAEKSANLPCEPASDDPDAVTLLVKMPNGNRLTRRFLRSDKLQLLFDFIDVGRVVDPGTYRVVRSFPRRAYTVDESLLTLSELGLTNKQEAFFLELI